MKTNHNTPRARRPLLGRAVLFALASGAFANAQAVDFAFGEDWTGSVQTQLSYGVSMRVQERDDELIGMANINPLIGTRPLSEQLLAPGRFSVNSDDGNLNYDEGDFFSNAVKATSELSLNYRDNMGAFVRASYFYDFENVDRRELGKYAKQKTGKDFQLLDAFVFWNYDIGGKDGALRFGRQVVSWGESTFIQNGINVINPVDVSKLRVAGSELKEAFLPVDMLYTTFNFTENLSAEALYMFEFEQTEPDPVGTYFSTNDFATLDGEFVMLNFGRNNEPASFAACQRGLVPASNALEFANCSAAVARAPDRFASDDGQYGFAVRYFADQLMSTEFGFYFLNYHSRLPLISGIAITNTSPSSGRYFVEYPEDIKLYGISFNTNLGETGIALQGELSHRDNMPLQVDDVELLFTALSPLNNLIPQEYLRFRSQLGQVLPGQEIQGWERHEVSQLQFTLTKVFGPGNFLRADQISVVGEFGGTEVWDLPDPATLRYQGDGTDTGGGPDSLTGNGRNPIQQTEGFPTAFSWGYRLAARADYPNAFGSSFTVSPRAAFNHDVNGITPGPGGNFLEDRRSLTVGVETNYLNKWVGDVSYTRFMGAGNLNLIHDRDFVSFTVKYAF